MRLVGIIVTHESTGPLPGLLASLAEYEPEMAVVVVDSGSPSGPPQTDVEVVALPDNVGFGRACNVGAAQPVAQGATHLVFLNPDVRLSGPTFRRLAQQMSDRIGVATGPMVDGAGEPIASAWGRPSAGRAFWFASGLSMRHLGTALSRLPLRVRLTSVASRAGTKMVVDGHVLGGAMVVRRDCWDGLRGFDEDFFLYWEDADLCERARRAGWTVCVLPCSPITHIAGTSSAGATSEQRWQWYLDGARRYSVKHLDGAARRRLLAALTWGRWLGRRSREAD